MQYPIITQIKQRLAKLHPTNNIDDWIEFINQNANTDNIQYKLQLLHQQYKKDPNTLFINIWRKTRENRCISLMKISGVNSGQIEISVIYTGYNDNNVFVYTNSKSSFTISIPMSVSQVEKFVTSLSKAIYLIQPVFDKATANTRISNDRIIDIFNNKFRVLYKMA